MIISKEMFLCLLLEMVCLFGSLFHFLLKPSTYLIFVKNKITTPYLRKGLSTNCCASFFFSFVCLFSCSVLLYWRSIAKGSSRQMPVGHLRVKKTLTFKPEAVLVKTNFICMRVKNYFHINDDALSLALKQRLGTTRKWLVEIVTLLSIGYYQVAEETGSIFAPQNSPTMHFDTTPTILGNSNQGWSSAKAKTRHFPILDLRGGGGHKFPIYVVQDCSKLFSSTTPKLPI